MHYAGYDPLTGLPTLDLLKDRLHQALRFAERNLLQVAVLAIDTAAGDRTLKTLIARIVGSVRDTDTVAQKNPEQFVLMLAGAEANRDTCMHVARRILDVCSKPIALKDESEFSVTCAIGPHYARPMATPRKR